MNVPCPSTRNHTYRCGNPCIAEAPTDHHQIYNRLWNDELEGHGRFPAGARVVRVKCIPPIRLCMPACIRKESSTRAPQGRTQRYIISRSETSSYGYKVSRLSGLLSCYARRWWYVYTALLGNVRTFYIEMDIQSVLTFSDKEV